MGQFFDAGSRTIFGAGSETIFVLYFSLLHTKKRLHYRGEGGSVKVKTIIFYVAKNLPTPPYTFYFSLQFAPPPFLIRFQFQIRIDSFTAHTRSQFDTCLYYILGLQQPAAAGHLTVSPAHKTTAATGAIFSLSEKKELGKGGVVESSGDQGIFYFFSGFGMFIPCQTKF